MVEAWGSGKAPLKHAEGGLIFEIVRFRQRAALKWTTMVP